MVKDSVRKAARSTYALYALVGPRIEIVDAVFDTALILEQQNTPKPKAAPFGRKSPGWERSTGAGQNGPRSSRTTPTGRLRYFRKGVG
jgi:hypothetical protein